MGCRAQVDKSELVRLVRLADGRITVDELGGGPGRGAYVHRRGECVRRAIARGSLARALRVSLSASEVGRLEDEVASMLGVKR